MNKNFLKKINVFLVCLAVLFQVAAGNLFCTAQSVSYPAPVSALSPELSYEIPLPDSLITYGGYEFAPNMSGTVSENSPTISSITFKAGPNESVVIKGKGFTGAEVYVYGLYASGNGGFLKAETYDLKETSLCAVIPEDFSYGMYLLWVKTPSGISYPVRVNAPEVKWTDVSRAVPGKEISIFGDNLVVNNNAADARVYITADGGYARQVIPTYLSPYKVTFTLPDDIQTGDCKIWFHNGHGGEYGWSKPLALGIYSQNEDIWTGDTHTVDGFTQSSIIAAINAASSYDTVYFPSGTYEMTSYIRVAKKLRFVGEDGAVIRFRYNGTGSYSNMGFIIVNFPSCFENIQFEDTLDSEISPFFIYANGYYDYAYNWVRAAGEQFGTIGLDIRNCEFKKVKTYSSNANADYSSVEGYTQRSKVYACLSVSYITDVSVKACEFNAPEGVVSYGTSYYRLRNNAAYGTWINDGDDGPCFAKFIGCANTDISNNEIYGADIITDPNGDISTGDKTFCRSIVFQGWNRPTENTHIADNVIDRSGTLKQNSGEQILFEDTTAVYEGGIAASGSNTVTVAGVNWTTAANNEICSESSILIKGASLTVVNGEGASQTRKIKSVDAAENGTFILTADRAFDIQPSLSSEIIIAVGMNNFTVYNNRITGPSDFYKEFNATCGVQAYTSMTDLRVTDNEFTNLVSGVSITSRYSSNSAGDYALFNNAYVENNTITNTRRGIMLTFSWQSNASNYTDTEPDAYVSFGTVVRNNIINGTVLPLANNISGLGGNGIFIGSGLRAYTGWPEANISNAGYISGNIIESNNISNCAVSAYRIGYNQSGTVLRNNVTSAVNEDITYEQSTKSGAPMPISPILIESAPFMYGTAEEGIYTSGANTSVFSLDPVDFLKNGDFSEGLKYWAPSYTVENQNTAYYASVENGALKLSPNGTSGNKVITSAAITVPESLKGKSMTVLMWYRADAAGRFQFGVYKNNYTNIFNNGYGNTYSVSANENLSFAAFNFTAPESGAVSLYLKAEGSMTFNMYIDRFALATKNADGTYNMFCGSFDSETELLNAAGYPCYGEEDKGMYVKDASTKATAAPAADVFNGNFEQGLKYWALANGTGYASDIGSIDAETGLFKTVGSKGTYNGLTSVYYNLPETAYGKKIVVKYDSKSTAGIGVTLTASNSTDTVSVSSDNFAKSKNVVSSLTKELTLAEGYTKLSVSFKQYGAADGDTTYIGNFRIYILDEGGLGLLADLDLSPVGYDYGDTNADGSVDIRDIVRLKSYLADSDDTKIYIAAANLAGETNMSLNASDVVLLSEKIILK